MINGIRADESVQILVLVCVPLVLLLLAVIILFHRSRRKTAAFADFSVTISSVGPQEAYVIYHHRNSQLEFAAEITKGKRFFTSRICVQVPIEMLDEDVHKIVPKLALGLTKLHYDYLIFRSAQTETTPDKRREAAVAELHQMGVEIAGPVGHAQVSQAVIHKLPQSSPEQTKAAISKVRDLMGKARGVGETIEVLASSV